MRRITKFAGVLAALLAFAAPLAAQGGSGGIVFFDRDRVLSEWNAAQSAVNTLRQERQQAETEMSNLESELRKASQEYEAQSQMLTAAKQQEREEALMQQQNELMRRGQELQQRLAQRQQELLGPVLQRLAQVVEGLRAEKGYAMVFQTAESGLVAADPSLDITDQILQRLPNSTASR